MKKIKIFIFILIGFFIIGIGWILFRHIYLSNRYSPFLEKMDMGNTSMRYDNRYTCGVGMPQKITHIRGNLYVTPFRTLSKNVQGELIPEDNVFCDLIIYVNFPSGYTVRADISDAYENVSIALNLNENMELLSNDEEQIKSYDLYYDSIYGSFEAANKVFGIFTLPTKKD